LAWYGFYWLWYYRESFKKRIFYFSCLLKNRPTPIEINPSMAITIDCGNVFTHRKTNDPPSENEQR